MRVAALGEVVTDCIVDLDPGEIDVLAERYDWFPGPGESVFAPADTDLDWERFTGETLPGGKGPNQAVAAAENSAAPVTFLGTVGEEDYTAATVLADRGVSIEKTETVPGSITAYIFTEEAENRIVGVKNERQRPMPAYVDAHKEDIAAADVFLVSNEIPTDTLQHTFAFLEGVGDGPTVVFDPSPIPDEDVFSYDSIDVVTPNREEYKKLSAVLDDDRYTVVRTDSGGASVNAAEASYRVPAPDVEPVDTTGAGDTFNGAVAGRLAEGETFREAVEYGVRAASLSVTRKGAMPAIPSSEEVRQL